MKLRVYDSGKDLVDRYSLYFPYPKKRVIDYYHEYGVYITGDYLLFSFSDDGESINRCGWDSWDLKYGYCSKLGKKVKTETLPKPVQKWIEGYEKLWNNLLKHPQSRKVENQFINYY